EALDRLAEQAGALEVLLEPALGPEYVGGAAQAAAVGVRVGVVRVVAHVIAGQARAAGVGQAGAGAVRAGAGEGRTVRRGVAGDGGDPGKNVRVEVRGGRRDGGRVVGEGVGRGPLQDRAGDRGAVVVLLER